jgi:hypothetical protein
MGIKMGTLLLILTLAAVAWLMLWTLSAEQSEHRTAHVWPFGYMTTDEYRRRYLDKRPS